MKNQVQLITYVDRLGGGGLRALAELVDGPLAGLFGGVHLLPFFLPIDGADAGFDPVDHTRVDPQLGGWDDVRALGERVDLMADVIVNHVSSDSPQFADWAARGAASPHDGLFLTMDAVFPRGASEQDLLALYRPRPGLPFTAADLPAGRRLLWTTFTPRQVDIDVRHPAGRAYLLEVLDALAAAGIRMVRLDAVGYAVKTAGTSCFMTPATFDFIGAFAGDAQARGMEVLVEVHSHYLQQVAIAARVGRVYDFALPPLVLHALYSGGAGPLRRWIALRPANAVTVLDTHDGIGIVDVGADREGRPGLLPPDALDRLVETIHERSGGASRRATGAAASNLDLYQVNCTFYDALGRDDRAYLVARAVQFFLPGVPQVYYVGLLAGGNDLELLERTGVGRDINRHRYARDEVERALERGVVRALCDLIRLRNEHPAFGGDFTVEDAPDHELRLAWTRGDDHARFFVDLRTLENEIVCSAGPGATRRTVLG